MKQPFDQVVPSMFNWRVIVVSLFAKHSSKNGSTKRTRLDFKPNISMHDATFLVAFNRSLKHDKTHSFIDINTM